MPVESGPSINLRNAVILAVSGALIAGALFVFVSWLAGTGGVEVQLGDEVFRAGGTERIAAEVADRGPILYSDVAGGTRDLYLHHLSDDPAEGWVAFAAQQPGAARDCFLVWQPDRDVFEDPCDGATFPPDGEGLSQFPVYVEDDGDTLIVDLNNVRASTTTAPAAGSSTAAPTTAAPATAVPAP